MRQRAVIYARISDDRTGLSAGVQRQEEDARALADRRGWDVVEVVVDNDISASSYSRKSRPGWRRVVELATSGEIQVISGYHTDRMYRRPAELEELIELAEEVLIATVDGDFRLDTADGRAMARVIAAMAAKESDDKSRRLRRKHLELAEAGQVGGGGRRPFGFEPDRVTVREEEAALIREATERILAGESLRAVYRDWTDRGVETVTGARWSGTTLRRLLRSPRVAGLRAHRGRVVGDAVWPAIVDRESWEAVGRVLAAPAASAGPPVSVNILSGVVRCGRCDVRLSGRPIIRKGHRYRRYHCVGDRGGCDRLGIAAEPLEDLVLEAFFTRVSSSGGAVPSGVMDLGDSTASALAAAEADLDGIAADLAAGVLGRSAYAAASAALEARIVELRRDLIRSRARVGLGELVDADDPSAAFDAMPWDRRRAALGAAIDAIYIAPTTKRSNFFDPSRVSIEWRDDLAG